MVHIFIYEHLFSLIQNILLFLLILILLKIELFCRSHAILFEVVDYLGTNMCFLLIEINSELFFNYDISDAFNVLLFIINPSRTSYKIKINFALNFINMFIIITCT